MFRVDKLDGGGRKIVPLHTERDEAKRADSAIIVALPHGASLTLEVHYTWSE